MTIEIIDVLTGIMEQTEERDPETERHALCPSCGVMTTFLLVGTQHWPPEVAKLAGLPARVDLYTCCNCHTTLAGHTLDS